MMMMMMMLSSLTKKTTTTAFAMFRNHHHRTTTSSMTPKRFTRTMDHRHRHYASSSSSSSSSSNAQHFDVIVVGGGHAGCEAAAAAVRCGARTALVTQRLDTIGELSCNPSVGGIGKGHLVVEIDAMDGLIGRVADAAGIHYRMLNRKKGPAVRGPRAQMDRDLYKAAMQQVLREEEVYAEKLTLIEASVEDLLVDERQQLFSASTSSLETSSTSSSAMSGTTNFVLPQDSDRRAKVCGVEIIVGDKHEELYAPSVVITTGTFLRGVLLLGHDRFQGGRQLRDSDEVEPPSIGLSRTFMEKFQFPLGRLKTGTPARIDGTTIDWDKCVIQPTENPAVPFSFLNDVAPNIQEGRIINCYQTRTNERTHELVMKYADLLPKYDGGDDGSGNGPRYCPSIFKKVERFKERNSHNCFLEPEGLTTDLVYPNGMSGPYPPHIQLEILRSMNGLEDVEIIKPGYDVEYDFCNPKGTLSHTLETKAVEGLYLAGQICGTTGYEEAAAQGIMAGANAADKNKNNPFILGRDEGYIGVLIDDLVTRGTTEPYRMFTSRAEYRISLRADNADLRLTEKAYDYGLVSDDSTRMEKLQVRDTQIAASLEMLDNYVLKTAEWAAQYPKTMGGQQLSKRAKSGEKKSASRVLAMPHVTLAQILTVMNNTNTTTPVVGSRVHDTVEAIIKYKSYEKSQERDMESWRKAQGLKLPTNLQYTHEALPTLSNEELEKLQTIRPTTLSEASQISGMTPQSLVYLHYYVKRKYRKSNTATTAESTATAKSTAN